MSDAIRMARKEFAAFFASPVAYIFLGAFLAVSLFVFFWVETFFARNIADMRSLFEWMPVLLIFLVAALTMRMWSEERRSGTLEMLMTLPISTLQLVIGKFLAALALVAIALALTLPLTITVSLLGVLDWGPVFAAYLAALLLGAAYIAIGLYVSARTDNQIVALIGTVTICGLFYLIGASALTQLFGTQMGEWMQLLGTGSRFDAITRGVIDIRDLAYYLSLVVVFLALNVHTLETARWALDGHRAGHRRWRWMIGLLVANVLVLNVWLQSVDRARIDTTDGSVYSISDATRDYLSRLEEPLLIRGYFSAQTHPLLSPLVPHVRDLLKEYEIAGQGRIQVEFIDPLEDPLLEREAGEKFGIRPVAFQTASKYESAVVNSYFDVLIQYGDQHEVLSYDDLIEVKAVNNAELDVRLRNPEYDITRTIKKALYAYQGGGSVFDGIRRPVQFLGFVSPAEKLPAPLPELREQLSKVLTELEADSAGKLSSRIVDPDAGDGSLGRDIGERYGFQPLTLGLIDQQRFYFYMVLESDGQSVPIPVPASLNAEGLKRSIEAGLKRFTPGLLRTVALYSPTPQRNPYAPSVGATFSVLEDKLAENATVKKTDLKSGAVPEDADLLVVVDPKGFDDKQRFAVDQFLMQGGTVVMAASPFHVDLGGERISADAKATGLDEWFRHHGIELMPEFVLDPLNTPFPIPVTRDVGGFNIREIQNLPYPFFADIRTDGMSEESGIVAGLGQITMNWASPIVVDGELNKARSADVLIRSSEQSWVSEDATINPDFRRYPEHGFALPERRGSSNLAVSIEGRFNSFYKDRPSPLLQRGEAQSTEKGQQEAGQEETPELIAGVVETSPESARLILLGSASFLSDTALELAVEATGTQYMKPVQLVENAVDWSLEDRGLLSLRGRGQFSRMLLPLTKDSQLLVEYFNYAAALMGLGLIWLLNRRAASRRRRFHATVMNGAA